MSTDNPEDDQGPISDDELNELVNQLNDSKDSSKNDAEFILEGSDQNEKEEIQKEAIEDPAILERLLANPETSSPRESVASSASEESPDAEDGSEEVIDPFAIDALIAGNEDEAIPTSEDSGVTIDQSAIDALIAGGSDDASSGKSPTGEDNFEEASPVSQEDTDALLSEGISGDDGMDDAEPGDDLESLLEEELKTISSGDADSLLNDGDAHESLVDIDMEERLDGVSEDQIAEVLDASDDDVSEFFAAPSEMSVVEEEEPEEPPEPVSEEVLQEVVGENLAAGAQTSTDEMVEDPTQDGVSESEPESGPEPEPKPETEPETSGSTEPYIADDSEEDYEETIITAGEWLRDAAKVPGVLVTIAREQPLRSITGLAAGLIVALSSYLFLSANQMRSFSDYNSFALDEEGQLRRAMAEAQLLIDEEDYHEAASTLEQAMIAANPKTVLYLDASYVKLEADVKRAPDPVSTSVANRLHGDIDYVVDQSPLHPRKPEALFWKGQLYEKEKNWLAARVEYRELLNNELQAGNRHNVLLALGELELNTDHPVNAATYLRQLRRQFPGTNEASKARLLLGDAYALAGDIESARSTFIDVAEANPTNSIGADAFARLGELAYKTGNFDQAIRELESRLDTATTVQGNDRVTLLLAKAYHSSGRLDESKNLLNSLIDFFPESSVTPLAQIELSRVLDELGLKRAAVRYATQVVQTYPDHPDVLRNAGELLQKNGDALDAARSLLAAHFAGADDPELLLAAGRLFAEAGAYPEAKKALKDLSENYARSRQGLLGNIELSKLLYEEGNVTVSLNRLVNLAMVTNSSSRKLPILKALGGLYQKMKLPIKVAEVYGEIAVLTNDPELLAQSAIAILNAGVVDDGLIIAQGIDVQQLTPATAYAFLNAKGSGIMRKDGKEGLGYLEQAHAGYPAQRSMRGIQNLLEANLTLDKSARARAIISELTTFVSQRENYMQRPQLEQAAITWGNYLFERGDYRAAAEAYATALESRGAGGTIDTPAQVQSDDQLWSLYQQANAYYKLSEFDESIPLYDRVAASTSKWAAEAAVKARSARLEQRLRGEPIAEARNAG